MSYPDFRSYLQTLKGIEDGTVKIHWPVIDISSVDARDHSTIAGLQLADIVASAFAAGVEPDQYGNCETRYAEELRSVTYSRRGNFLSYGTKFVPVPSENSLSPDQQRMFGLFKNSGQLPGS